MRLRTGRICGVICQYRCGDAYIYIGKRCVPELSAWNAIIYGSACRKVGLNLINSNRIFNRVTPPVTLIYDSFMHDPFLCIPNMA